MPDGFVPNSTAHGSLIAHLKWEENEQYQDWLTNYFNKVTCRVTREQWNAVTAFVEDYVVVTESRLQGMEMVLVIHPEDCVIPILKTLPLWKPKYFE